MKKPKLSIIVPVYNVEKYLCQCLDSILNQTITDIEVICVNDGSCDHSLSILEEYKKKDSRIRIISKQNDGLGAARNTGINMAQGDYIGFVDSDDFVALDMFQKLYDRAVATTADVAIGNIRLFHEDTRKVESYREETRYKEIAELSIFTVREVPWILENIGVWDRIYKRNFIERHSLRNPEHVIYEDALFSFQTSILASRITVVPDAYYIYRKGTGTAITDREIKNDAYKFDFLTNCQAIKEFMVTNMVYEIFKENYLNYFFKNALWHQSNILNYIKFKDFYNKAQRIITRSDMVYYWHHRCSLWKTRLYAILLFINCPWLCYKLFFYKRKKLRSFNYG